MQKKKRVSKTEKEAIANTQFLAQFFVFLRSLLQKTRCLPKNWEDIRIFRTGDTTAKVKWVVPVESLSLEVSREGENELRAGVTILLARAKTTDGFAITLENDIILPPQLFPPQDIDSRLYAVNLALTKGLAPALIQAESDKLMAAEEEILTAKEQANYEPLAKHLSQLGPRLLVKPEIRGLLIALWEVRFVDPQAKEVFQKVGRAWAKTGGGKKRTRTNSLTEQNRLTQRKRRAEIQREKERTRTAIVKKIQQLPSSVTRSASKLQAARRKIEDDICAEACQSAQSVRRAAGRSLKKDIERERLRVSQK